MTECPNAVRQGLTTSIACRVSVTAVFVMSSRKPVTLTAFEVNGANFQSGATTVDFGPGITVSMVLFVDITIVPPAVPGSRTATVTNPDGGSGSLAAGFTVN